MTWYGRVGSSGSHGQPGLSRALEADPSTLLNNLTLWWKMDEESGTRADTVGSNDWDDVNTVGFSAGLIGNAADFVAGNNEYFRGNYSLFGSEQSYTMCQWQYHGSAANRQIFNATLGLQTTAYTFNTAINASAVAFQNIVYDSVSGSSNANITEYPAGDAWRLLVWGYDASDKRAFANLNAGLTQKGAVLSNGIRTDSDWIGTARSASTGATECLSDLMGLWVGRVLTDNEISELYNGGAGVDHPFD